MTIDSSGIYIASETIELANPRQGNYADFFILKIDNKGNLIWNVTFDSSKYDSPRGIIKDSEGNLYVVGRHRNSEGSDKIVLLKYKETKGLIPTTIGAKPFYTLTQNPQIINLKKGESKEVVFRVNATGPTSIDYDFFIEVKKLSEKTIKNKTNTWQVSISESVECPDNDNDDYKASYCGGLDCDDNNAEINPKAKEICNDGIDNNCNGKIDEDCGIEIDLQELIARIKGWINNEVNMQDLLNVIELWLHANEK